MANLSRENWQQLTDEALRELPADLREFVIIHHTTDRTTVICGGNPEIEMSLELSYWTSGHEKRKYEQENRKPGDYVNECEEEMLDMHDGLHRKQLHLPLLCVVDAENVERGLYVERINDADFKREVQEMICEALFNVGHLAKQEDGRFIRESGEPVLLADGTQVRGAHVRDFDDDFEDDDEDDADESESVQED